ncbi:hypothetical protein [Fischerella thermalis]|uniref:hypothetical protein n=1 Tax=Fischerella thermalis TaxID=372787 RepID=UPI0015E10096|nr:hypothetical protein [Fischerella thermalis]
METVGEVSYGNAFGAETKAKSPRPHTTEVSSFTGCIFILNGKLLDKIKFIRGDRQ